MSRLTRLGFVVCCGFLSCTADLTPTDQSGNANAPGPSAEGALPPGGGALADDGSSSADPLTGDASYSYSLLLPPGRDGFTPSVSLSYSSSRGNSDVGRGFVLAAGASIERDTTNGVPKYDSSDRFVFDGTPLLSMGPHPWGTEYRFVSDSGDIQFIYNDTGSTKGNADTVIPRDYWYLRDSSGKESWLKPGVTAVVQGNSREQVFRWLLSKERDVLGNVIEYLYSLATPPPSNDERVAGRVPTAASRVPRLQTILYGGREPITITTEGSDGRTTPVRTPALTHLFRVSIGRALHAAPATIATYQPTIARPVACTRESEEGDRFPRPDLRSGMLLFADGEDEYVWGVGIETVAPGTVQSANAVDKGTMRSRVSSLVGHYRLTYNWDEGSCLNSNEWHQQLRKIEYFGIDEAGAAKAAPAVEFTYNGWDRQFTVSEITLPSVRRYEPAIRTTTGAQARSTWFPTQVNNGLDVTVDAYTLNRYQVDPRLQQVEAYVKSIIAPTSGLPPDPFVGNMHFWNAIIPSRILGPSTVTPNVTSSRDAYFRMTPQRERSWADLDGDSKPDLLDFGASRKCYWDGTSDNALWYPQQGGSFGAGQAATWDSLYRLLPFSTNAPRSCSTDSSIRPKNWETYFSANGRLNTTTTNWQGHYQTKPFFPDQPNTLRWMFQIDLDGDGFLDLVKLILADLPTTTTPAAGQWYWYRNLVGETGAPGFGPGTELQTPFPWENSSFWTAESRNVWLCAPRVPAGVDERVRNGCPSTGPGVTAVCNELDRDECRPIQPESWKLYANLLNNGRNILAASRSSSTSYMLQNLTVLGGRTPWYETFTNQDNALGDLLDVTGDGLPDRVVTALSGTTPVVVVYPQTRPGAFGEGQIWWKKGDGPQRSFNVRTSSGALIPQVLTLSTMPRVAQSVTHAYNQDWNPGTRDANQTYVYPQAPFTLSDVTDQALDINADGLTDFVSTPQIPLLGGTNSTGPATDCATAGDELPAPGATQVWPNWWCHNRIHYSRQLDDGFRVERPWIWWAGFGRGVRLLRLRGIPESLSRTVTKETILAPYNSVTAPSGNRYNTTDTVYQILDYNGDGLPDMVSTQGWIRFGTGQGFSNAFRFAPTGLPQEGGVAFFGTRSFASASGEINVQSRMLLDYNADGRPDMLEYIAGTNRARLYTDLNLTAAPGRLSTVVSGGKYTQFRYKTAADKGIRLPQPKWMVDSIKQWQTGCGAPGPRTSCPPQVTRFAYATPIFATRADANGAALSPSPSFRGFERYAACSATGIQSETYRDLHTPIAKAAGGLPVAEFLYSRRGVNATCLSGEDPGVCQDRLLQSCRVLQEDWTAESRLRERKERTFVIPTDDRGLPMIRQGSQTLRLQTERVTTYDRDSGLSMSRINRHEYRYVNGRSVLSSSTSAEEGRPSAEAIVTRMAYTMNGPWTADSYAILEVQRTTEDGRGTVYGKIQMLYDGQPYGRFTKGLKSGIVVFDDATDTTATGLLTRLVRDSLGHVIRTESASGQFATHTCYDSAGMYPVSSMDAQGLRTESAYDLANGNLLDSWGPVKLLPSEYVCSRTARPRDLGVNGFVVGMLPRLPAANVARRLYDSIGIAIAVGTNLGDVRMPFTEPTYPSAALRATSDPRVATTDPRRMFFPLTRPTAHGAEDIQYRTHLRKQIHYYPPRFADPLPATEWGEGYERTLLPVPVTSPLPAQAGNRMEILRTTSTTATGAPPVTNLTSTRGGSPDIKRAWFAPVSRVKYDGFGRAITAYASYSKDVSGQYLVAQLNSVSFNEDGTIMTTLTGFNKQPQLSLAGSFISRTYSDASGRMLAAQNAVVRSTSTLSVDAHVTRWAESRAVYDNFGLQVSTAFPTADGLLPGEAARETGMGLGTRAINQRDELLQPIRTRDALNQETLRLSGLMAVTTGTGLNVTSRVYPYTRVVDSVGLESRTLTNSQGQPLFTYRYPDGPAGTGTPLESRYIYDPIGRLTRSVDENGAVIVYEYDFVGRSIAMTRYGSDSERLAGRYLRRVSTEYDLDSRVVATTTTVPGVPARTTRNIYTGAYLTEVRVPEAPASGIANYGGYVLTYQLDANQEGYGLVSRTDSPSETLSFTYGLQGITATTRQIHAMAPGGLLNYSITSRVVEQDLLGRALRSEVSVSFGKAGPNFTRAFQMVYDQRGLLTSLVDETFGRTLETYAYNDAGALRTKGNVLGASSLYYSDKVGRVREQYVATSAHGWAQQVDYMGNGLPQAVRRWDWGAGKSAVSVGPSINTAIGYDYAARSTWVYSDWTLPDLSHTSYGANQTYQQNRINQVYEGTPYTAAQTLQYVYGSTDPSRLTGIGLAGVADSQLTSLGYDAFGARSTKNGSTEVTDPLERLVQTSAATYIYGIDGSRTHVAARKGGRVQAKVGAVHCELQVDGGATTVDGCFLYVGSLRLYLGSTYVLSSPDVYSVHTDNQGSPALTIFPDGSFHRLEFSPYGKLLYDTDNPTAPDARYLPFNDGFQFGWTDYTGSGLTRFGARDYDPETRRWTSVDPIFTNDPYQFVNDNPWIFADPSGLAAVPVERPTPPPEHHRHRRQQPRRGPDSFTFRGIDDRGRAESGGDELSEHSVGHQLRTPSVSATAPQPSTPPATGAAPGQNSPTTTAPETPSSTSSNDGIVNQLVNGAAKTYENAVETTSRAIEQAARDPGGTAVDAFTGAADNIVDGVLELANLGLRYGNPIAPALNSLGIGPPQLPMLEDMRHALFPETRGDTERPAYQTASGTATVVQTVWGVGQLGQAGVRFVRSRQAMQRVAMEGTAPCAGGVCGRPGGGCFLPGTVVATAGGEEDIENLVVGERVRSPDDAQCKGSEIEKVPLSKVELHHRRGAEDLWLTFLRPTKWVADQELEAGGLLWLDLPEFHLSGYADVLSIEPFDNPSPGTGCVITSVYRRRNGYVRELRFDEGTEPLFATAGHPFRSLDREAWVTAEALLIGERVATATGFLVLASREEEPEIHWVYNLEVDTSHSYLAGRDQLWVHNNPPGTGLTSDPGVVPEGFTRVFHGGREGYGPQLLPQGGTGISRTSYAEEVGRVFVTTDPDLAWRYGSSAVENAGGVGRPVVYEAVVPNSAMRPWSAVAREEGLLVIGVDPTEAVISGPVNVTRADIRTSHHPDVEIPYRSELRAGSSESTVITRPGGQLCP